MMRGIRDALKSIVPSWLADRADGLNKGFKVLYTIAQMADGIVTAAIEGAQAALPGIGTATALPNLGASRGLIRGLTETDAEYAARLRDWLTTWNEAGSDYTLLKLLQIFLGNNLKIRLIDQRGNVTTIDSFGVFTRDIATDWNWNGEGNHSRNWSNLWVIVYLDSRWPTYTNLTDTAWVNAWGTYDGFGAGHQVPREAVNGMLSIIADQKGAHTWVQAIAWTKDFALFNPPSYLNANDPDGTWTWFSKLDPTTGSQIRARTIDTGVGTVRYWMPFKGG